MADTTAATLTLANQVSNMPPSAGLRAHVQLARISGFIVCETYKIAPKTMDINPVAPDIDRPMGMLRDWLMHLPPSLQMPSDQSSTDPACCNLHMAHNQVRVLQNLSRLRQICPSLLSVMLMFRSQLILITTRPILLTAVKRCVAERYMNACSKLEQQPQFNHIDACSKAAQRNIHLAQWVMQLYHTRRLLQAGLHFVFNAAVILLLNRVLRDDLAASDQIDFAISVFAQQSRIGTNYERDCLQVLKDLKILIDRILDESFSKPQNYSPDPAGVAPTFFHNARFDVSLGRQILPNDGDNVYQELMTWIQDDSSQLHSSFRI
jgi:hypothetical protein